MKLSNKHHLIRKLIIKHGFSTFIEDETWNKQYRLCCSKRFYIFKDKSVIVSVNNKTLNKVKSCYLTSFQLKLHKTKDVLFASNKKITELLTYLT